RQQGPLGGVGLRGRAVPPGERAGGGHLDSLPGVSTTPLPPTARPSRRRGGTNLSQQLNLILPGGRRARRTSTRPCLFLLRFASLPLERERGASWLRQISQ